VKNILEKLLLASLTAIIIFSLQNYHMFNTLSDYLVLLGIVLLLYLVGPLFVDNFKKILIRTSRICCPKIGILNGYISDPKKEYCCRMASTNVTSYMWYYELRKALCKMVMKRINLITVSEIDDTFSMIINPFTDNFPEEDTEFHPTFYKIRQYIENGGIFVNPGGAFFWNQNTLKPDIMEETILRRNNNAQLMSDTPLFLKFGVSYSMEIRDRNGVETYKEPFQIKIFQEDNDKLIAGELLVNNNLVKKFRAVQPGTKDYIPLLREEGNKSFPIAAIPYRHGFLLLIGLFMESESSEEFKIAIRAVKNMIENRFKRLDSAPFIYKILR